MILKLSRVGIWCMLLASTAVLGQNDAPAPSEDCRFIKAADLSDAKAPTFGGYPTRTHEEISTASLDLESNPIAKTYRTVLRREMAEGPNYAGHYRVAIWGCGASCAMFAVVNLKTGNVITANGFTTVIGAHLLADDFLPGTKSDGWGFRYENGSSLLVVLGEIDEDESRDGAYYFVLQNEALRLIHTTHVNKSCGDPKP
jgi:hypothetical protein